MKKIFITTGDKDGIGLEVTAKALYEIGPQKNVQFILFRSDHKSKKWLNLIDKKFSRQTVADLDTHYSKATSGQIIDICSSESPTLWFKSSIGRCLQEKNSCLVTGPISKPLFLKSGLNVIGHTGLLKKMCKKKHLFMAFKGAKFNVLLVTDHIPLNQLSKAISEKLLDKAVNEALIFKNQLPSIQSKKKIAVLGLNPHSGDSGLIGKEDQKLILPFIDKINKNKQIAVGPLVPDAAFVRSNWNKYSVYVCMYHDQGLIPFKTIHGTDSGIHITMGLPFLRVSVDHGTAKDIFNKNIANPGSMIEAINYAIKFKQG